jgi:hypothetical protein
VDGFFFCVETKAGGKMRTALQIRFQEDIVRAGGIALWGDDVGKIVSDLAAALVRKRSAT